MLVSFQEPLKHLQLFKAQILGQKLVLLLFVMVLCTEMHVNLACLAPELHHVHEISCVSLRNIASSQQTFDTLREMKTSELSLK